ncbi:MAG: class I SAM-dependent methyltransferase [Gammaproteobacteria bacterium]|nr:class I SAM-dependent methyltransferase [Gammaproteobacteria bacterium]NIR83229.1 class I SAM-dependent methyltransferase [Gammaproteobacteria bacterium]NIR91037.1 class I SAM-dependent methyltransferase [Gammaproteobacteria bacterium]NIU04394.1 class I SAM-dependent methyltransferase [Gammaproteobacteria bacterium]NIV52617.1 methyltransferase domain-containing protein [Gammaproteobacteria bacterium]
MRPATNIALDWSEQGRVPDALIRHGIRRLCRQRLDELRASDCEAADEAYAAFLARMEVAPIAPLPHKANEQHYEVPAAFYSHVLGPRRKYSCCYWPDAVNDLEGAETEALARTCEHAALEDGLRVLELGCGWGSLTLWMAQHYPNARITAVSNSRSQREHIEAELARRRVRNVEVVTCDMNDFDLEERFDRVVSVEMFEHMRNYRRLFERIHGWLVPGGRFFMHIFCHRLVPYAFVDRDESDWMSRHFFSGGMMPSDDLPLRFQDHLKLVRRWRWSGLHYQRTANAWLANLDARRDAVWPLLECTYGRHEAGRWWMRWRIFFMACAELFGYDNGQEWWVSHYAFQRPQ